MTETLKTYRKLTPAEKAAANKLKEMEEYALRALRLLASDTSSVEVDQRAMALAITNMQQAYMWAVRAVTKPGRITGPIESTPPEPAD